MTTISKYIKQLKCLDSTSMWIQLSKKRYTDSELSELIDCLLFNPNAVTHLYLDGNKLTDESGIRLAQFLARSTTIRRLCLSHNKFSKTTYLSIAAAFFVNSSLRELYLYNKHFIFHSSTAFIKALRLNPVRLPGSTWCLFLFACEFERLTTIAKKSSPPSMLEFLLYVHFDRKIIQTIKY